MCHTDSVKLQNDPDSLTSWSSQWLLKFSPNRCKVMHVGHQYDTEYYMSDGITICRAAVGQRREGVGVTFTNE